jgi:hypothetical protein
LRVIILGKAKGCDDAPFHFEDKEVQTWGLNNHILTRPLDIVFEPHDVEWWMEHADEVNEWHKPERGYAKHIEKVNEMEIPYITLKHYPFIPTSQKFPVEEIYNEFGLDYYTGGIDYMIAYAILKRVERIDIYGVHTTYDDEYAYQKPSLEAWCFFAMGKGIDVRVHGSHSLFKTRYQGKIFTNDRKEADGLRYGYFVEPFKMKIIAD